MLSVHSGHGAPSAPQPKVVSIMSALNASDPNDVMPQRIASHRFRYL
jgi:hypothetical protein